MENKELVAKALEARSAAYTPYSGFRVGAALYVRMGQSDGAATLKTRPLVPAAARSGPRFLKPSAKENGDFLPLPSWEDRPGRSRRISARPAASAAR